MTFTYNTGVPASGNDPSVDQPDMLINTISSNGIWNVDHVGFNSAGGGTHKQITFQSNNVPSIPTTPPVLFTNTVGSVPQLFFYSGTTTTTTDQYVNASNGSTYLLGGMILKWGQFTTASATQVVSYTTLSPVLTNFPNACYAVILTPINSSGVGNYRVSTFNASSFTVNSVSGASFMFTAIGY